MSLFESGQPNIEAQAQALVEQWKSGPVVLASSSQYRLAKLQEAGYKDITMAPVPDEEEKREHTEIIETEGKRGDFFDKRKTKIPQRIAESKIKYLLEQGQISPDVMIVALDTLPMSFRRISEEEKRADSLLSWWPAAHMSKPKSLEDAKAEIFDLFSYVGNEYLEYENYIQEQIAQFPEDDPVWKRDWLDMGRLPKLVRIDTGVAIRFPGSSEIETTSSFINLRLLKVYELANNPEALRELVDKVIETMMKKGKTPLNIGGGIDYSDPDIRDLLKVNELDIYELAEQGVYKGFPSETFERFVHFHAAKSLGEGK